MPGWIWGILSLGILIVIIGIVLRIIAIKKIDETVENEINKILETLNYHGYVWNNYDIYSDLKNKIKGCIMDNRKNWPTLARSYQNCSPQKMNEIKKIVKEYLQLDQK